MRKRISCKSQPTFVCIIMSFRENLTLTERWKIKTSSIIRHPGVCSESLLLGDNPLGSLVTMCSLASKCLLCAVLKEGTWTCSEKGYRVRGHEGRAGASRETAGTSKESERERGDHGRDQESREVGKERDSPGSGDFQGDCLCLHPDGILQLHANEAERHLGQDNVSHLQ